MNPFDEALPMIHAVVGRYLEGEDSFEDAATSLAGVLRRIPAYDQAPVVKHPKIPTMGGELRKLTPEQWMNPMIEKGMTITGFSIAPGPFDPERNERAHALFEAALKLLYDRGAA